MDTIDTDQRNQHFREEVLPGAMDGIKNAPPGTSITGPVSNPFNEIDATGILIQEGIKKAAESDPCH